MEEPGGIWNHDTEENTECGFPYTRSSHRIPNRPHSDSRPQGTQSWSSRVDSHWYTSILELPGTPDRLSRSPLRTLDLFGVAHSTLHLRSHGRVSVPIGRIVVRRVLRSRGVLTSHPSLGLRGTGGRTYPPRVPGISRDGGRTPDDVGWDRLRNSVLLLTLAVPTEISGGWVGPVRQGLRSKDTVYKRRRVGKGVVLESPFG